MRLVAGTVVDAKIMITHRFGLAEAGAALAILDRGQENALKIVIEAQ